MPDERTYGFARDDAESLIQSIGGRQAPFTEITQRPVVGQFVVILDDDLPAASHALTGPTSCTATVCEWSTTDEEYTETAKQITVWNHSENANHVVDTFGYARWIDNHWHFFGDCHAMNARA
jgi:hypothetical protein